MEESSKNSALILFCTVLGALVALVGLLYALPPQRALSAGLLLVAVALISARRTMISGPLREDQWSIIALIAAALGLVLLLSASREDSAPGSTEFGGPGVTPTATASFRAKAGPDGAVVRSDPERSSPIVSRFESGTEISFDGFCLGDPANGEPPFEFRWYIVSGGLGLVPGSQIAGDPPPGSSPQPCSEASYGFPDTSEISLDIGYEYDFLDGIRDPTDPDTVYPFVLGVVQSTVGQVGFAAELNDPNTASNRWVGLGISTKLAPHYAFVLYLPDGIIEAGLDPDRPVRVLATPCYAPGQPGLAAAAGTLILFSPRPLLSGERTLPLGAASVARSAACTPVVTASVG